MKIGIDISSIIYGTGVSVYTKKLIENLLKIDQKNEYLLYGGSMRRMVELKREINGFRSIAYENKMSGRLYPISPTLADIIFNRLHFVKIETLIGKIEVFHSSDWTQPPSSSFKVTTIHDLTPLKYPKISDPKIVFTHKIRFKRVKDEVDRIIVPSKVTANDLKDFGIAEDRIRIIPEAPSERFKKTDKNEIEKMKRKFRISGDYILAVGVSPRKNIRRIIKAHEIISAELGVKLVIVGYPYIGTKQKRGVLYLGHVDQDDMSSLFSGAKAFVYPSLYEGFGIPILEAFSTKTPVVTSNIGSMAEVAGNGAVLVDPYNSEAIAEGIIKATKDKETLLKLGSKIASKYSWKKNAELTLQVYDEFNN